MLFIRSNLKATNRLAGLQRTIKKTDPFVKRKMWVYPELLAIQNFTELVGNLESFEAIEKPQFP